MNEHIVDIMVALISKRQEEETRKIAAFCVSDGTYRGINLNSPKLRAQFLKQEKGEWFFMTNREYLKEELKKANWNYEVITEYKDEQEARKLSPIIKSSFQYEEKRIAIRARFNELKI